MSKSDKGRSVKKPSVKKPSDKKLSNKESSNKESSNKKLEASDFSSVSNRIVDEQESGQRIDNYLVKILKGVPKSRIYKAIRGGEVRINGGRVKASSKIHEGDSIRIPPVRVATVSSRVIIPPRLMESIPVLFEDDHMMIVNKPAGLAVHGGTGLDYGLIEAFRELSTDTPFLELVHRLDRETSGCLILAKSRKTLLGIQELMSGKRGLQKKYQALVVGNWSARNQKVTFSLRRKNEAGEEKRMVVDRAGQISLSIINTIQNFKEATLLEVDLKTGRMHQARVHCASSAHPIAGDRIYGDRDFNRKLQKIGLGRMFLHASSLNFKHPITGHLIDVDCPLPDQLRSVLERLDTQITQDRIC